MEFDAVSLVDVLLERAGMITFIAGIVCFTLGAILASLCWREEIGGYHRLKETIKSCKKSLSHNEETVQKLSEERDLLADRLNNAYNQFENIDNGLHQTNIDITNLLSETRAKISNIVIAQQSGVVKILAELKEEE